MIEIRTYDGEPAELAAFCTGVWRDRYRDKMAVPLWSGPFMEWELLSDEPGARDFLVAAYDGGRLIGALPVEAGALSLARRADFGLLWKLLRHRPGLRETGGFAQAGARTAPPPPRSADASVLPAI